MRKREREREKGGERGKGREYKLKECDNLRERLKRMEERKIGSERERER